MVFLLIGAVFLFLRNSGLAIYVVAGRFGHFQPRKRPPSPTGYLQYIFIVAPDYFTTASFKRK